MERRSLHERSARIVSVARQWLVGNRINCLSHFGPAKSQGHVEVEGKNYGEITMSAYWLARAKINDPVQYNKYTDPIAAVIDEHGGRILVRGGRYEILEGTTEIERHGVIEFPAMEAVVTCYHS